MNNNTNRGHSYKPFSLYEQINKQTKTTLSDNVLREGSVEGLPQSNAFWQGQPKSTNEMYTDMYRPTIQSLTTTKMSDKLGATPFANSNRSGMMQFTPVAYNAFMGSQKTATEQKDGDSEMSKIASNKGNDVYWTKDGHVVFSKQETNDFRLVNQVNDKNFTYEVFTMTSRTSEFTFPLHKQLYNVIDYQVLSFHSPVNVPVVSAHNNKLIIVDNLFNDTGEMRERVITIPELGFPEPLHQSVRTEAEHIDIMFEGVIEVTNNLSVLMNTDSLTPHYTDKPIHTVGNPYFPTNAPYIENDVVHYYEEKIPWWEGKYKINTAYFDIVWENIKLPLAQGNLWAMYFVKHPEMRKTHKLERPDGSSFYINPDDLQRDGRSNYAAWLNYQNWRCRIVIVNPDPSGNGTRNQFYIKPSPLLEQLGIYAFDTPSVSTPIASTFNNFENSVKTLSIYINSDESATKTLHFFNSEKKISFETPFLDPARRINNKRLEYSKYPTTDQLKIKMTIGNDALDLFDFYNNSFYMTVSVMYEVTEFW